MTMVVELNIKMGSGVSMNQTIKQRINNLYQRKKYWFIHTLLGKPDYASDEWQYKFYKDSKNKR